jgi:hypothetical protein
MSGRIWADSIEEVRQRIIDRPLNLEGVRALVWGGDDTSSLIFGACKCEDSHNQHATFELDVGSRAASWSIRRVMSGTPEERGVWAVNGIQRAYEERKRQDLRAQRGWA